MLASIATKASNSEPKKSSMRVLMLSWLVDDLVMLLVVCQLSRDVTNVRKTTQEAWMFPHFKVSIAAKKLGLQIRRVKRAGCMFSAANQTPTASVENGNQDQIPLHSMIGLNDGFI